MEQNYISRFAWFNNMITGVRFSEDQLVTMFSNISRDELNAWLKEVRLCFQGTEEEEEVSKMRTAEDLAHFYYENAIEY